MASDKTCSFCDCTGYPILCNSEEALQWFNKGVYVFVTQTDAPLPHLHKALEVDKSLVLAHCVMGFMMLSNLKGPHDPKVAPHLDAIDQATSTNENQLTKRELSYIKAIKAYASGSLFNLAEELVNVLYDYPLDILAVTIARIGYNLTGEFVRERDMIARALPFWSEDMQFYPNILAFYAFALEECFERGYAEEVARKALAINKRTPQAIHTLAHVIDETYDPAVGVELVTSTREDWAGSLQGHITWHLTLYYLDLGDLDSMFQEFDNELVKRAKADNLLGLIDTSSLLWRLNCLGIDCGQDRWQKVQEGMTQHIHGNVHRSVRFDKHMMMVLAHGKVTEHPARLALAEGMLKVMENYTETGDLPNCEVIEKLGVPVCNALLAFGKERYDEVLQIMLPLHYDFINFGGSYAQRQVLNLTMIQAAINAKKLSLALQLVSELKHQKPHNKLLEKLYHKLKTVIEEKTAH